MRQKTTRVICNFEPDTPVSLALSPLAVEDLTDTPVYRLTSDGLAEICQDQSIILTPLLLERLAKFTAARLAREKARGKDILQACTDEEMAAINLAWALECTVNKGC